MFSRRTPTIAILNTKGGCGKTTIATNLAAQFVQKDYPSTIADYDPQSSSGRWLQARPSYAKPISHVSIPNLNQNAQFARSWHFHVPHQTKRIIIDTPAGFTGIGLDEVIQRAQVIVIPVLPSAHDVRATASFITDLLLNTHYRRFMPALCVIANRVEKGTLVFGRLQRFLSSLNIPFVASFSDSRHYLHAAEKGVGIMEMGNQYHVEEIQEWQKFMQWIDGAIEKQMHMNASQEQPIPPPSALNDTHPALSHHLETEGIRPPFHQFSGGTQVNESVMKDRRPSLLTKRQNLFGLRSGNPGASKH